MATAAVVEIADALVAVLNAAPLSQAFAAKRAYLVTYELEDLQSLKVSVVPSSLAVTPFDLDARRVFEWDFGVWIQRRVENDTAKIDALMKLAEEVIDLFANGQVGASPALRVTALGVGPSPDPDRLFTDGVFTTVVALAVRVVR